MLTEYSLIEDILAAGGGPPLHQVATITQLGSSLVVANADQSRVTVLDPIQADQFGRAIARLQRLSNASS